MKRTPLRKWIARAILCSASFVLLLSSWPSTGRTSGSAARVHAPQVESKTKGKFDAPVTWPESTPLMIHASVMRDGRVLFWGRDKATDPFGGQTTDDVVGRSKVSIWNPETNSFTSVNHNTTNLFCAGHSFLPDGRLFVAGGHVEAPWRSRAGSNQTNIFDPLTNLWSNGPLMATGRWYPFTVTLDDGRVAILGGSYAAGGNAYPTQYQPEIYDPATNTLALLNASDDNNGFLVDIPLYPYTFLDTREGTAPDPSNPASLAQHRGVFVAGPFRSFFWNPKGATNGKGSWSPAKTLFQVPSTNTLARHNYGTAVLYDSEEGKILLAGGMGPQDKTLTFAQTITLNHDNPAWEPTQPMKRPRTFHTATLLPDGKVLVTGGVPCQDGQIIEPCYSDSAAGALATISDTQEAEIWDPSVVNPDGTKGAWTLMAKSQVVRGYHSVALLLPDGRVLVGGSGAPDGYKQSRDGFIDGKMNMDTPARHNVAERRVEFYSPPYLFDDAGNPAQRPEITSAPAEIGYGQQFPLTFSNSAAIQKVTWVRLNSVTHDFATDQRINVLNFTTTGAGQLNVTTPSDARKCPPGYYMLFVFNSSGVPSKAKIVRIHKQAPQNINGEEYIARRSVRHNNRIHVFYRHLGDTSLHYISQTASDSNTFNAPVNLGGGLNSNPIAIKDSAGRLQVFVLGLDNAIYTNRENAPGSGTWSGFTPITLGPNLPVIAGARNIDGRIQIFYRGSDNALWYIMQTQPGSTTWTTVSLGGGLTSEPAVGMNPDGRLEVFVRGVDNALYHIRQLSPGGPWSAFAKLGGQLTSGPFVAHQSDGRLDVFIRGTDAGAWHIKQSAPNSSSWSGFSGLGGVLQGDHPYNSPSAALGPDGRVQIFVRWSDNSLRTLVQSAPNGNFPWNAWTNLGGWIDATVPPPTRSTDGRLFIVVRGGGGALFFNTHNAPNSYLLWNGFAYFGDAAHSF